MVMISHRLDSVMGAAYGTQAGHPIGVIAVGLSEFLMYGFPGFRSRSAAPAGA